MFKYLLSTALLLSLTACSNDAQVASHNLSNAADNFQLNRRVVFYNGITWDYMLTTEGKCSLKADDTDNQLEVTCKTGDNSYKKHFLGLSDNISYFSEQIDGANVSVYHYKVTFKPEVIVPDVDMKTSLK